MNDLLVQVYNTKPHHKLHSSDDNKPSNNKPHPLNDTPIVDKQGVAMETTPQSISSRKRRGAAGESVAKLKKRKKHSLDEETADALKEKLLEGKLVI